MVILFLSIYTHIILEDDHSKKKTPKNPVSVWGLGHLDDLLDDFQRHNSFHPPLRRPPSVVPPAPQPVPQPVAPVVQATPRGRHSDLVEVSRAAEKPRKMVVQIPAWLVVWNMDVIFPYINPNWLSFFSEGLKPPTSKILGIHHPQNTQYGVITGQKMGF